MAEWRSASARRGAGLTSCGLVCVGLPDKPKDAGADGLHGARAARPDGKRLDSRQWRRQRCHGVAEHARRGGDPIFLIKPCASARN